MDERLENALGNYFKVGIKDLSLIAFRLYSHYKSISDSNGLCLQSVRTLSEECNMAVGSVVKARKELEAAGLIEVSSYPTPHGGRNYLSVRMTGVENETN